MNQYIAVIHKDTASAFGVHFPDIPGCFSAADSFEQVVPNAVEALTLFAEDSILPQPRSLEAIREDKNVREALAQGAMLIAVPYSVGE